MTPFELGMEQLKTWSELILAVSGAAAVPEEGPDATAVAPGVLV